MNALRHVASRCFSNGKYQRRSKRRVFMRSKLMIWLLFAGNSVLSREPSGPKMKTQIPVKIKEKKALVFVKHICLGT